MSCKCTKEKEAVYNYHTDVVIILEDNTTESATLVECNLCDTTFVLTSRAPKYIMEVNCPRCKKEITYPRLAEW